MTKATKSKAKKAAGVPVTRAALLARLKRELARTGDQLITSRSAAEKSNMGDFYVVDVRNTVSRGYPILKTLRDVEALARERGVLKPWEALEGGSR